MKHTSHNMPPPQIQSQRKSPKFTRGEKCLFTHLIVTFVIILLMTIIYFVHLCTVNHTRSEVFKIYRRSHAKRLTGLSQSDYESIGVVFLNITPATIICNTLLLRESWSLAPAQCSSMRDDPDMSEYLFLWKIKYRIDGRHIHSDIKRTLTHSHFNRGDYFNNIGLFEHVYHILKNEYYVAPKNFIVSDQIIQKHAKQMVLTDWELQFSKKGDISDAVINQVRPIPPDKCSVYVSPIVDQLRDYEFCVMFEQKGPVADHGAMLVINSKIVGFFSWGDIKGRGVPLIILNILHFREWFESIVFF